MYAIRSYYGDGAGISGAEQPSHGVAGRFVAGALVPFETFRLDRQNRNVVNRFNPFAHRFQVVADEADDAGRVDSYNFV